MELNLHSNIEYISYIFLYNVLLYCFYDQTCIARIWLDPLTE